MGLNKKKYVTLGFLLSIILTCGCGEKKGEEFLDAYRTYVESYAADGIIQESETNYWSGCSYTAECKEEAVGTIGEYTIRGRYSNSRLGTRMRYPTHYYFSENGQKIGIRNNELVYFSLMNNEFLDTEQFLDDVEDAEMFVTGYAKRIAEEMTGRNLDEYTMRCKEPVVRERERDGQQYYLSVYSIWFFKPVDSYETSDFVSVRVTSKGHLLDISLGDIGAFDGYESEISRHKVKASIEQKIKEVYSGLGYKIDEIEVKEQVLTKTPDDKNAICSEVTVNLLDANKRRVETLVYMLTFIP